MNKQEIFDKVATHLLTQNKKAQGTIRDSSRIICLYKTPENLKCAIGALIPEELFEDSMNYAGFVGPLLRSYPKIQKYLEISDNEIDEALQFLYDLQSVHDQSTERLWPRELYIVAERHNLEIPQIVKDRFNTV